MVEAAEDIGKAIDDAYIDEISEQELAGYLKNHVENSFGINTEQLGETGSSGFYCVIEGKRFKIRVTECGEDI